jgi:PKD repeat protein
MTSLVSTTTFGTYWRPLRQTAARVGTALLLLMLAVGTQVSAQVLQANILGNVISTTTNLGVPNKSVVVQSIDSLNQFLTTVTTNANGSFTVGVPTRPNIPTAYIVRTMDCQQNWAGSTVVVTSGQTTQTSLRICTTPAVLQCAVSFTSLQDSTNRNAFAFDGRIQCNGATTNVTSWTWLFGDSASGSGQNVSHTYNGPGVYNVCLTATYGNGQTTTSCQTIVVRSAQTSCTPSFIMVADTSVAPNQGRTRFVNTSQCPLGTTYLWTLGNGASSTQASPVISFLPGTYNICLVATTPGAQPVTSCQTLVIRNNPVNCANQVRPGIIQRHNGLSVHFLSTLLIAQGLSYRWDFGNGNISTLANPIHQYSTAGTYGVCLTVTYSPTCQVTVCDTVYVSGGNPVTPPPTRNRIIGTVFKGQLPASEYGVEVVGLNGNPFYRFRRFGRDSIYSFDSVPAGRYLVRAWLLRSNPDVRNWLPTYYGNKVLWRLASVVNVSSATTWTDINLIPRRVRTLHTNVVRGNIGTIGMPNGRVAAPTANDLNTFVLLADDQGNPYEVAWLDANRNYTFDQLAAGTYQISVESPTMPSAIANVTVGAGTSTATANFANTNDMMNVTITALEASVAANLVRTYPNPTSSSLTIGGAAGAKYSVLTTTGATMSAGTLADADEAKLNVETLPTGIYMLQLELPNGLRVVRRISKQ